MSTFALTSNFLSQYKGKRPDFGPVGEITYRRTYSRPLDDGEMEEFYQTIQRVVEGVYSIQEKHCKQFKLPWSNLKAQKSAQEMFRRMWDMKFLPPGRGLWAMGTNIVEKLGSAALMNCAFTSTKDLNVDFAGPFCFLMDMSMLGVGVGFDTLGTGKITIKEPITGNIEVVEDSREGWVSLIRRILDAYGNGSTLPSSIDYSKIRPAGTPLKTFGGIAAGSAPLENCVKDIHKILKPLIDSEITSEAIVDLMNVIGKCVVSGNIRRSAELAIGNINDDTFLNLKNKKTNSKALYNHRWASNNSVSARIGEDYTKAANLTAQNGEPGYIWFDNAKIYGRIGDLRYPDPNISGFNPCVEQPLEDREMCCLVETFPARHEDYDDYERTLKFAYLYGKTVTLIPTHDERTNAIIMKNRRIGTSQSGIIQNFQKIGKRQHFDWCEKGYDYLRNLDGMYSDWLCIPRSIKVTTVKPSGSVSLLPGATPGVHYPHSEYYFRTIRFASNSNLIKILKKAGYRIEDDKYSPDTQVVYFPVHEKYFDRSKKDVSMWEQLENTAQMQQWWSDNGVSATISFKPEEAEDIKHALQLYETRLKAISFLPLEDHGYEQAPYQEITKEQYEEYISKLSKIKWKDVEHETTDMFCDTDTCNLPKN